MTSSCSATRTKSTFTICCWGCKGVESRQASLGSRASRRTAPCAHHPGGAGPGAGKSNRGPIGQLSPVLTGSAFIRFGRFAACCAGAGRRDWWLSLKNRTAAETVDVLRLLRQYGFARGVNGAPRCSPSSNETTGHPEGAGRAPGGRGYLFPIRRRPTSRERGLRTRSEAAVAAEPTRRSLPL